MTSKIFRKNLTNENLFDKKWCQRGNQSPIAGEYYIIKGWDLDEKHNCRKNKKH
jgi:hypothetical protein